MCWDFVHALLELAVWLQAGEDRGIAAGSKRLSSPSSRQDFIRIPSSGCNQNRAGSRGMPRESIPPVTPAPRRAQRGLPEEPSASRPTEHHRRKRESRERVAIFKKC
jgi:hypothetical protein